jgi:tellurite resistance protein
MRVEDLKFIADILMGAAHADGRYQDEEADAIRKVLKSLMKGDDLPGEVDLHLKSFDHDSFNLEQACFESGFDTEEKRRFLLHLVTMVSEVDDVYDLDESAYMTRVAKSLGADRAEYGHLAVEYSSTEGDKPVPPPIPPELLAED